MKLIWQKYAKHIMGAGVIGIILALWIWPDRKPIPEVLDNVYCAAEALAIAEYAEQRAAAGDPLDAEIATRIAAHKEQSTEYLRGLRRRDDPANIEVPVHMNSAQTTRDAALDRDPAWYVSDTMPRIDACVPKLSAVSSL